MDRSEEQFQNLIANLVPRVDKALSQQNSVPPLGLLLFENGDVEVVLSASVEGDNLSENINLLQQGLINKAKGKPAVAACLAHPDYVNEQVVAYLENNENFCAKCNIPVVSSPSLRLDLEGIEIRDGTIFVFGEGGP